MFFPPHPFPPRSPIACPASHFPPHLFHQSPLFRPISPLQFLLCLPCPPASPLPFFDVITPSSPCVPHQRLRLLLTSAPVQSFLPPAPLFFPFSPFSPFSHPVPLPHPPLLRCPFLAAPTVAPCADVSTRSAFSVPAARIDDSASEIASPKGSPPRSRPGCCCSGVGCVGLEAEETAGAAWPAAAAGAAAVERRAAAATVGAASRLTKPHPKELLCGKDNVSDV
eukprot:262727-Chlamydomonas_euryale.AAC.2